VAASTYKQRPRSQPYAYYGFTLSDGGGTFHLHCPACQGEEMEIVEEHQDPFYDGDYKCIGDLMRCWVCKREFRVTENCWKRVVW
jgi:hypothetical protein